MKIILCGSISASDEILKTKKLLEENDHVVEIPEGVKNVTLRKRTKINSSEKAKDKIKYDVIRKYFDKMKRADVVLIINPTIKKIKGYIGGNTLIEMAFAHVLNKKLYLLYDLPNMSYLPEILATKPIVLKGNLNKLYRG